MGESLIDGRKVIIPKSSTKTNDFESNLFRNGVLDFNPMADQAEISDDIARYRDWLINNPYVSEESRNKRIFESMSEGVYDYSWRQFFNGLIPSRWKDWREARKDFDKAGELGIQLSTTLVDAGVSHKVHHTVEAAGKSQKLDLDQLTMVMANPNVPWWGVDEVLEAQRKKGTPEEMIKTARDRAKEIIKEREERQKNPKIESNGNNQLGLNKG